MSSSQRPSPIKGWLVHGLTLSGIVFAFLTAAEIASPAPDARIALLWLGLAVLIDAADGPLARRWEVKRAVPSIDGRVIDDLIDYLTFTFLPLMLVWRMGWLAGPSSVWVVLAMAASLLGFANVRAKQEASGFFLGFPSYWNIYAFYAGLWAEHWGPLPPTAVLIALTVLTVSPARFLYPNLTPRPWRVPVLWGAAVWVALLTALWVNYPAGPEWLIWISLAYPAFYLGLSVRLDLKARAAGTSGP